MSSKKWLMTWCISTLSVLIAMILFAYAYDPFNYYKMHEEDRFVNDTFTTPGLIKNYDYDTVIIGSSMTQNYEIQFFRDAMGVSPLKVTCGGLTTHYMIQLYDRVMEYGKVKTYIINIDLSQFAQSQNIEQGRHHLVAYLMDDSKLNDIQYLLGYEAWFRFIPVDLFIQAALRAGVTLPEKFDQRMKIDYIGDWRLDASFSRDIVINRYIANEYAVKKLESDNLQKEMIQNITEYAEYMLPTFQDENQYIFIFPPYSALYWHTTQRDDTFDSLMDAKLYFIQMFDGIENVRIVDMQSHECIVDLDNYRDSTHFSPQVQMIAAEAIAFGGYDTSVQQAYENCETLRSLINDFRNENQTWLD